MSNVDTSSSATPPIFFLSFPLVPIGYKYIPTSKFEDIMRFLLFYDAKIMNLEVFIKPYMSDEICGSIRII